MLTAYGEPYTLRGVRTVPGEGVEKPTRKGMGA